MKPPIWFTRFVEEVLRVRLSRGQRVVARVVFDGADPGTYHTMTAR